jgi:rRNA maturation endonuclease Nob1
VGVVYARVVLAVSWQEVLIFAAILIMAALIYTGRRSQPRWVRVCRTCGLENVADAQACERCGARLERRDMAPRR